MRETELDSAAVGDYLPIAAYGAIGNLRTVALVGLHGAIDWCCFPDLDGPSLFASLLDRRRGGSYAVRPLGPWRSTQRYVGDTNVLETRFRTPGGEVTVTDFMPIPGGAGRDHRTEGPPEIHRIVRCERGAVEVGVEWAPRFDYARRMPEIRPAPFGFVACAGTERVAFAATRAGAVTAAGPEGPLVRGTYPLRAGETLAFVMHWGAGATTAELGRSATALRETLAGWRSWVDGGSPGDGYAFAGRWRPHAVRGGLALKLLTHAHTGAIAAAATTSLPEEIGGVRNWDYRFTWIRDAAFTAQALFALGHPAEGTDFLRWAEHVSQHASGPELDLRIMYGLHGETELHEEVLDHLEGYRGSRPVRIGNAASLQRQHDIYGELLNAADELVYHQGSIEPAHWGFLAAVADKAAAVWREPDYGIWEVRREPRHFVYSKVMVWVALDRALWLAGKYGLPAPFDRWRRERDAVRDAVLEDGYDRELGAFVQSFGSRALDASNLLIPLVGLLPFDDPRVRSNIDRTLEQLTHKGLVYRYLTDDGLPGSEGTFGLTTCWLIDSLAMSGRLDEAGAMFEGLLGYGNHLGLFSEEIGPVTGELLGNFPQAFTHVGIVNSLVYLAHAEGRPLPFAAPIGSPEHAWEKERTP